MKQITETELKKLSHKDIVKFAVFCAYRVEERWNNTPECVEAIRMAELWLEDKATSKECEVAYNLTYHAAYATYAGGLAANIVKKEQRRYYEELLHCDEIAEKALLGEVI